MYQDSATLNLIANDQASDKLSKLTDNLSNFQTGVELSSTAVNFLSGSLLKSDKQLAKLSLTVKDIDNGLKLSTKKIWENSTAWQKFGIVLENLNKTITKITAGFMGLQAGLAITKTIVNIKNELNGVSKTLDLIEAQGFDVGGSLAQLNLLKETLYLNTAAAENLATVAVTKFNEFGQALTQVNTIMGESPEVLQKFGEQIQELVSDKLKNVVSSTDALSGSYEALSAGFAKGAEANAVMEAGLKLSSGTAADSSTTMRALVQTLRAYNLNSSQAAETAGKLNAVVEQGLTTIPELSQGIGQVSAAAKAAGINLNNVGSMLALITLNGTSTAEAFTQISSLSGKIISPETNSKLKELGVQTELNSRKFKEFGKDASNAGKEVILTLKEIYKQLNYDPGKLYEAVGGEVNAYRAALTLVTADMTRVNTIAEKIAQSGAEQLNNLFNLKLDNDQVAKFATIINRINELMIKLGRLLFPIFEEGVKATDKLIKSIENFVEENQWLIKTLVQASIAFNKVINIIGNLIGLTAKLTTLWLGYRLLTGDLFKSIGNVWNAFTKLNFAKVENLKLSQKLLLVGKELLGFRTMENLSLDNTGKLLLRNKIDIRDLTDEQKKAAQATAEIVGQQTKWQRLLNQFKFSSNFPSFKDVLNNIGVGFKNAKEKTIDFTNTFLNIPKGFQALKTGVNIGFGAIFTGLEAVASPMSALIISVGIVTKLFYELWQSQKRGSELSQSISDANKELSETETNINKIKNSSSLNVFTILADDAKKLYNWIFAINQNDYKNYKDAIDLVKTSTNQLSAEILYTNAATRQLEKGNNNNIKSYQLLSKGYKLTADELKELLRLNEIDYFNTNKNIKNTEKIILNKQKEIDLLQKERLVLVEKGRENGEAYKEIEKAIKTNQKYINDLTEINQKQREANELLKEANIIRAEYIANIQRQIGGNALTTAFNKNLDLVTGKIEEVSSKINSTLSGKEFTAEQQKYFQDNKGALSQYTNDVLNILNSGIEKGVISYEKARQVIDKTFTPDKNKLLNLNDLATVNKARIDIEKAASSERNQLLDTEISLYKKLQELKLINTKDVNTKIIQAEKEKLNTSIGIIDKEMEITELTEERKTLLITQRKILENQLIQNQKDALTESFNYELNLQEKYNNSSLELYKTFQENRLKISGDYSEKIAQLEVFLSKIAASKAENELEILKSIPGVTDEAIQEAENNLKLVKAKTDNAIQNLNDVKNAREIENIKNRYELEISYLKLTQEETGAQQKELILLAAERDKKTTETTIKQLNKDLEKRKIYGKSTIEIEKQIYDEKVKLIEIDRNKIISLAELEKRNKIAEKEFILSNYEIEQEKIKGLNSLYEIQLNILEQKKNLISSSIEFNTGNLEKAKSLALTEKEKIEIEKKIINQKQIALNAQISLETEIFNIQKEQNKLKREQNLIDAESLKLNQEIALEEAKSNELTVLNNTQATEKERGVATKKREIEERKLDAANKGLDVVKRGNELQVTSEQLQEQNIRRKNISAQDEIDINKASLTRSKVDDNQVKNRILNRPLTVPALTPVQKTIPINSQLKLNENSQFSNNNNIQPFTINAPITISVTQPNSTATEIGEVLNKQLMNLANTIQRRQNK